MDENETPEGETPLDLTSLTELSDITEAVDARLDEFNELRGTEGRTTAQNARIVALQAELTVLHGQHTEATEAAAAADAAEAPSFDAPSEEEAPAEEPAATQEEAPTAETPTPETPDGEQPSIDAEAELQAANTAIGTDGGSDPSETPAIQATDTVEWMAASTSSGDAMTHTELSSVFSDYFTRKLNMPNGKIQVATSVRHTETSQHVLGQGDLNTDLAMATAIGWHDPEPGGEVSLDLAGCCLEDAPVVWDQPEDRCRQQRPIYDWLPKAPATGGCVFKTRLRRDPITGQLFEWAYDCDDTKVGLVDATGAITMYDPADPTTHKPVNLVADRGCDTYAVHKLHGYGFQLEQSRARMLCDPRAWAEAYGDIQDSYNLWREAAYWKAMSDAALYSGAWFNVVGTGPNARSDIRAMLAEIVPGIMSDYCIDFNDAAVFTERGVAGWLGVEDERSPDSSTLRSLDSLFAGAGINGGFITTRNVLPGQVPNFPNRVDVDRFLNPDGGNAGDGLHTIDPTATAIDVSISNKRTLDFLVVRRNNFRLLQGPGQRLNITEEKAQATGNMDRFAQLEDDEVLVPRTSKVDAIRFTIELCNGGGKSGYDNVCAPTVTA